MRQTFIVIYNNGLIHKLDTLAPYLLELYTQQVIKYIIGVEDMTRWDGEKFVTITHVS